MGLTFGLATSHMQLFAAFPAQHFRRTATKDKIANSGVRLQQDSLRAQLFHRQVLLPFRHSFACSFFPKGASPSRGPGISCLTCTCSRQQLQQRKGLQLSLQSPQSQRPPSAACMNPAAPQPDAGRAPSGQTGGTLPCTQQLAVPCFLPS